MTDLVPEQVRPLVEREMDLADEGDFARARREWTKSLTTNHPPTMGSMNTR